MSEVTRVAVIGLGETASLVLGGLQTAALELVGFDPARATHPLCAVAGSLEDAVAGAQLVLSLGAPMTARAVAAQTAPLLEPGAVFADVTLGSPGQKRTLAVLFPDGAFADLAVLAQGAEPAAEPGTAPGAPAPLGVAGSGARRVIELLEPAGAQLDYVSEQAGDATARRLLLDILHKGMAGVLIDTLWAAESVGQQRWAFEAILREFDAITPSTAQQHLSGTAQHLKRRQMEMLALEEMLRDSAYASTTVAAVETNYSRILHGKRVPFSKVAKPGPLG